MPGPSLNREFHDLLLPATRGPTAHAALVVQWFYEIHIVWIALITKLGSVGLRQVCYSISIVVLK
jgi:hypothetical protein